MKSGVMDDTKLIKYKTVMCQRMVRAGTCRYGHQCDFAHDARELRRNLNQFWYQGVRCDKPDHEDRKCEFAHNDSEVMYHPNVYKTKMCEKFSTPQGCPNNQYCAYAHGKLEFRNPKFQQGPSGAGSRGQGHTPSGAHGRKPSFDSNQRSHSHQFNQNGPPQHGQNSGGAGGLTPVHHQNPHRQSSFNTFSGAVDVSAPVSDMHSMGISMSLGEMKEFQDSTNDLKIRILDLVDQISAMHFDRAAIESEKSKGMYANETAKLNALLQDSYSRLQQHTQDNITLTAQYEERVASLQKRLSETQENLRRQQLLVKALSGDEASIAQMSSRAREQLTSLTKKAATALAGSVRAPDSSLGTVVNSLDELAITESPTSPKATSRTKHADVTTASATTTAAAV